MDGEAVKRLSALKRKTARHMLTLIQAAIIVDAALTHARKASMPPMTAAVLDAGGHLVAFKREDGSSLLREKISRGKAMGALNTGAGSRSLVSKAQQHPSFIAALQIMSDGNVVPVPGGVLIRCDDGRLLGAVGVSGHMPDEDEACAVAGIQTADLVADTGS